jgi:mannose-6-phosphate isomerase
LKHLRLEPTVPRIIQGSPAEKYVAVFPTPAPDFELSRLQLAGGQELDLVSISAQIFIVMEGSVEVAEKDAGAFTRKKGEAWISFDGARSTLKALEDAVIYRAGVGKQIVDGG